MTRRGWAPSSRAVLRIVDATGAEARPFLEAARPPENDGEVLVIQVDGKGAPAITSREYAKRTKPHARSPGAGKRRRHERRAKRASQPKKRRAPGDKSKNARLEGWPPWACSTRCAAARTASSTGR